jgi:Flp pilus assembly protein TadG
MMLCYFWSFASMVFGNRFTGIFVGVAAGARRFGHSRGGSVAIMMGLVLPVVIGMTALGSEIVFLLFKHRQMQSVADAAALSAATAIQTGYPGFAVEARAITASLGFNDQVNGVTITPNNPPATGPNTGNSSAVEVIVSQPQTLFLVTLFRSGLFNLTARAVALPGTGTDCVLQLNGSPPSTGVTISNGANVNLTTCGLAADSTGNPSLLMNSGAQLNAQSVSVSGTASITNGAAINPSSALKTSQPAVLDPYAGVAMPSYSGCGFNNKVLAFGTWTLSPGVYCNGLSLGNGGTVTMNPGVYFINQGVFSVQGGVTLTGTGVTIVLTSSTGSGYATVNIANGTNVTLSAPTAGATAGIVFFGDRSAPASNVADFGGGATINVTGALYFPTQEVIFQNGSSNSSSCTQLIAGTIQFTGGSNFQHNCPTGVAAIGGTNSTLSE